MRRWLFSRLWHFDRVAAKVAAWCRRARRCFDCGRRLNDAERIHYGHTCERCEGARMREWDDTGSSAWGDN